MDINKLILHELVKSIDPTFTVSEGYDFFYVHQGTDQIKEINAILDYNFLDEAILESFIIQIKDSCVTIDGISNVVEINLAEIDSLDKLRSAIKLNMLEVIEFHKHNKL